MVKGHPDRIPRVGRGTRLRRVAHLVVLGTLSACGGPPDSTEWTASTAVAAPSVRVEARPRIEHRLDASAARRVNQPDSLRRVTSAARLSRGAFLVVYDNGARLGVIGAAGRRPPLGGWDTMPGSFVVFAAADGGPLVWNGETGELRRAADGATERVEVRGIQVSQPVAQLDDAVIAAGAESTAELLGSSVTEPRPLLRIATTTRRVDTIALLPASTRLAVVEGTSVRSIVPPFGRRVLLAAGGGRVYLASTDRFAVTAFGDGGRPIRRFVRDVDTARVSAATWDSARAQMVRDLPPDAFRDRVRMLLASRRAPQRPALYGLLADACGNAWVQTELGGPEHPARWTVLGRDGAALGDVVTPPRLRLLAVDTAGLIAVRAVDRGVDQIALYPPITFGTVGGCGDAAVPMASPARSGSGFTL